MSSGPREVVTELYLDGWTPITATATRPVTIQRGRLDWGDEVSPTRMSMVVFDEAGELNPDNPIGPYYGLLKRNTPIRHGYVLLRDTFGRSVTDGWGSSTPDAVAGHVTRVLAYTLSGTASEFDVDGALGTVTVPGAGAVTRRAYLAAQPFGPVDVLLEDVTISAPGGTANSAAIMLRGQSTSDYVSVGVTQSSGGVVTLQIRDTDDNTILASFATGLAVGTYHIRAQAEGNTIRGKVWLSSGSEPYDFQASATSLDMARVGWVGVRVSTGSGGAATFTVGGLVVSSVRFFGDTRVTPSGDGKTAPTIAEFACAGHINRLERGTKAGPSVIERFVLANATSPRSYWPTDDGNLSIFGRVASGNGRPAFINNVPGGSSFPQFAFGTGTIVTWLNPVALIENSSILRCNLLAGGGISGHWTVHWGIRFNGKYNAAYSDGAFLGPFLPGEFTITYRSSLFELDIAGPAGPSIGNIIIPDLYDGSLHHMMLRATQDGADTDWLLVVDGDTVLSGTIAATTVPILERFAFSQNGNEEDSRQRMVGHVIMYSGDGPPIADVYSAYSGQVGEVAGRRAESLCAQNGIPFSHYGDLDDTKPMGPQRPEPVIDLLRECAATHFASLLESRMAPGLYLRTGATRDAQTAAAALDYSAGQLVDDLALVHDDRDIINQVTVRRVDGSEYRESRDTGPLNTGEPGDDPDAVGVYDRQVTVNPDSDEDLPDTAAWVLHLGGATDPRVPNLTVLATHPSISDTLDVAVLDVDVDDRIDLTNLTSLNRYDPLPQLAHGYTEVLDTQFLNRITFSGSPEQPYQILTWDEPEHRWDTSGAELPAGISTTATAVAVHTPAGKLWETAAAAFPFDIMVGGERMTVTAVSAAATYVGVGVPAHAVNASVTPGLPTGLQPGDSMIIQAAIRNSGTGTPDTPAGWDLKLDASNMRVFGRYYETGDTDPTVTFTGGVANADTSAQCAAWRGASLDAIAATAVGATLNGSAQDIAVAALSLGRGAPDEGCLSMHFAWKADDWTSVAAVADGIEVGEPDTTTGDDQGIVWDYRIIAFAGFSTIGARTFTVTGGGAAISRGACLVLPRRVQTFTVTRSVNGVIKAHDAGTPVSVADPRYWGLHGSST